MLSLAVALGMVLTTTPSVAAGDKEHRVPWTFSAGIVAQAESPNAPPPGANDFSCDPGRRDPVVLVHGFLANRTDNWQTMSPYLANRGFCVFALTYGTRADTQLPGYQPGGITRMQRSARQLKRFVNKVRRRTGSSEVDIVGHSEGSLMPNWYVTFMGGRRVVDDYVALTPLWDGTMAPVSALTDIGKAYGIAQPGLRAVRSRCAACTQFLAGSRFLERMHRGRGVAVPGVEYTNIMTRNDELVVPYTSGRMRAPNATNIVLQEQCALDQADHASALADPVVAGLIYEALTPRRAPEPPCVPVTPGVGAPTHQGR